MTGHCIRKALQALHGACSWALSVAVQETDIVQMAEVKTSWKAEGQVDNNIGFRFPADCFSVVYAYVQVLILVLRLEYFVGL